MKKITIENAQSLIRSTNGAIFSVCFVKSNGELRDMTCRLGVRKYLKGKGQSFEPAEYDLLTVYDLQSSGYRMIKLDTLVRLAVDGKVFEVV